MKIGKIACIVFLALLCNTHSVIAQDTVKYRLAESMLPDSTLFRYELGSVSFTHSGTKVYLKFTNASPATLQDFFRTETFTVQSTSDSISFFRFASFDDKFFPNSEFIGDSGSTEWTAFINAMSRRYGGDSAFYVKPSSAYFNNSSTVFYIVSLYNASDNSLLLRLDTLASFLRSDGKLGYTCYPTSNDIHYQQLNSIGTNVSAYISVERVSALPIGSYFVDNLHTESTDYSATPRLIYSDKLGYSADRHDAYALPVVSGISDGEGNTFVPAQELSKKKVFADYHTIQKFTFYSDEPAQASLIIYDSQGRKVMESENVIAIGANTLLTDTANLASGAYSVVVAANSKILFQNSILIVH